ncbi:MULTISPECIES: hypothetical protein [unclassified Streptomyces]|uniref:hypothetical protein n=1 Tax=unclassified Streptomyces TaxID=2593676 RepID=UPI0023652E50|nr:MULTISPECIES: hypothetical protein [unclassified Streptomyces]MDF3142978.1 hypothetical protein [Streptomyces sp. T21Q-yed]WDF43381.1 hypothetical protein PBV52_44675 [Streptomyces sp. T12]
MAASADGGRTWTYRGTLTGLDTEWGRNTFWAPEIIWHDGLHHMYVSYIRGVSGSRSGGAARVVDGSLRCDRDEPVRNGSGPMAG